MSKISVIIPVYKVEKYLARCVDSILAQTFKDYELILVDDGSPDNCPAMCDEYAKKYDFIKVIHIEHGGQSKARNFGIDYALTNESEWIAFIDSDDWIHKRYFELLYNTIQSNGLKICCCKGVSVKKYIKDKKLCTYATIITSPEELYVNFLLNISTACMGIYSKFLFSDRRFPYGKIHEDEFIMPMMLYSCNKIGFIDIELYYYFQNAESTTHREKTTVFIDNQLEGILTQLNFFAKNNYYKSFNKRLKRFKSLVSNYYRIFKDKKEFRKIINKKIVETKHIVKLNIKNITCYNYKKISFKKWVIGISEKQEDFKKEKEEVKKQKGTIYSFLWGIKNHKNYKW